MTDRPIIFSAPMVRALLDGRKTQTRRLVKVPGIMGGRYPVLPPEEAIELGDDDFARGEWHYLSTAALSGPYPLPAAVGDRLYVREACRAVEDADGWDHVDFLAGGRRRIADTMEAAERWMRLFHYGLKGGARPGGCVGKSVPSIHMPRWASRLTLIVEKVRCERLQTISREDAIAEGLSLASNVIEEFWRWPEPYHENLWLSPPAAYRHLWNQLHTEERERWEDNPFVVALTFRVVHGNIDQVPA